MSRASAHRDDAALDAAGEGHGVSMLPTGFDTIAWTRAACEASGVPFAVEDPVTLAKLRDLAEHPA